MLSVLLGSSLAAPLNDRIYNLPGFDTFNFTLYSGYLDTTSPDRLLHYMFFTSMSNNSSDPIVLWLNGGPGCSSLIGAFSENGPFLTNNSYKNGDTLIRNNHSWNQFAHMLYIESPAGVGFSVDKPTNYTDQLAALDNYAAVISFFKKFMQLRNLNFFIAGQSYAGKYIPDLAKQIVMKGGVNLKGVLIGNGVFNFENDQLQKSQIQYLINHNFIEQEFKEIYQSSCRQDWRSPRCQFFQLWFRSLRNNFNVYNIFDVCTSMQAQQLNRLLNNQQFLQLKPCYDQNGMAQYLNTNRRFLNIKDNARQWSSCNAEIKYHIDQAGSIASYHAILSKVRILIFSGDFDDQVPLDDTQKNIRRMLRLQPIGEYKPWFHDFNHAGFVQLYHQNLTLVTVKGAGHMVPQDRRGPSHQMFYNFLRDRPINTQVD